MGLEVFLQCEDGNRLDAVGDPHNVLHRLLPSIDDTSYQCLRFIDWYGDTVFNQLQMNNFLAEWQRLYSAAQTDEETRLLRDIESLARKCEEGVHLYLKFYGD